VAPTLLSRIAVITLLATALGCGVENDSSLCTNQRDDDGDYLIDCEDPNCASLGVCVPLENCTNGADDNADGAVDCDDTACAANPSCQPTEACGTPGDEDGDGAADCLDSDCAADPACVGPPEDCGAAGDEDGDGAEGCADSDCALDPLCAGPTGSSWTRSLAGASTSFGEEYELVGGLLGLYLIGMPNAVSFATADADGAPLALTGSQ
jgi:hypothetical protein